MTPTPEDKKKCEKFRKKPVVIEAIQFLASMESFEAIKEFVGDMWNPGEIGGDYFFIRTLEGDMKCSKGDWVIKGVNGEFYPCKPDIFLKTYDILDNTPPTPDKLMEGKMIINFNPDTKKVSSIECGGIKLVLTDVSKQPTIITTEEEKKCPDCEACEASEKTSPAQFEENQSEPFSTPDKLAEARELLNKYQDMNLDHALIDVFLAAQDLVSRAEQKKEILDVIAEAYYIDKNFNLDDLENLKSLEGDIVLAWPSETKEIVTLWCNAQNSLTPN